jgi:hypothetical protein
VKPTQPTSARLLSRGIHAADALPVVPAANPW